MVDEGRSEKKEKFREQMQREVDRTMTDELSLGHFKPEDRAEELEKKIHSLQRQLHEMDLRYAKEIEKVKGEMKEEVKRETFKLIMLKQKHFGDTDEHLPDR